MLSQDALQQILGIKDKVYLSPMEMADKLNVVFFPVTGKASDHVIAFAQRLKESLHRLHVNIVPYNEAWERVSVLTRFRRFFKYLFIDIVYFVRKIFGISEDYYIPLRFVFGMLRGKKIKNGISVICIGEQNTEDLPMQYISNFKSNSIVTVLDYPQNIKENSNFTEHFDVMMSLFAYHMTNIVIGVDDKKWMVYNFNASHPQFLISDSNFDQHILDTLVPKMHAPISPHVFADFNISKKAFNVEYKENSLIISEMKSGAILFDKTHLYPSGKKISDLPFRHNFHKLIGKLHLDNRNGMSFGFIAFQLPTKLSQVYSLEEFTRIHGDAFKDKDYFYLDNALFVLILFKGQSLVLKVPDVWVMTLRSGSDKTHFDTKKDVLKMGLIDGKMWLEFPENVAVNDDYKPSFDTKVILAHAVGNAIIASISKHLYINNSFVENISTTGISISHWHGYFNDKYLPSGVYMYGLSNPHVSCSSPQSAIFALRDKLQNFSNIQFEQVGEYVGDIHVEPHHGINFNFPSLSVLAKYILDNPEATQIGNKYLKI